MYVLNSMKVSLFYRISKLHHTKNSFLFIEKKKRKKEETCFFLQSCLCFCCNFTKITNWYHRLLLKEPVRVVTMNIEATCSPIAPSLLPCYRVLQRKLSNLDCENGHLVGSNGSRRGL